MGQAGPSLGIALTESYWKKKGKRLQVARCAARGEDDLNRISSMPSTFYIKQGSYCFMYCCTMKERCLPKVLVMEVVFLKLEKGTSVDRREGCPNWQKVLWVTLSSSNFQPEDIIIVSKNRKHISQDLGGLSGIIRDFRMKEGRSYVTHERPGHRACLKEPEAGLQPSCYTRHTSVLTLIPCISGGAHPCTQPHSLPSQDPPGSFPWTFL